MKKLKSKEGTDLPTLARVPFCYTLNISMYLAKGNAIPDYSEARKIIPFQGVNYPIPVQTHKSMSGRKSTTPGKNEIHSSPELV